MKRIILLAGTILIVPSAVVIGHRAYNYSQMTDFMKANLEALTQDETKNGLVVTCANRTYNSCLYVCPSCHSGRFQYAPGPIKRIHGYCDCGARIDYEE